MIEIIKAIESLLTNVEVDIKIRSKESDKIKRQGDQDFILKLIDKAIESVSFNSGLLGVIDNEDLKTSNSLKEQIPEKFELLTLTLKDFMSHILQSYPSLEGYIYHGFLTDLGVLVLLCDPKVYSYIESVLADIEVEARRKIGVSSVYIGTLKENEKLTEELIDEVLEKVIERHSFDNTSFDNLTVTEEMEGVGDAASLSEVLSVEDLYVYVRNHNKEKINFPAELSEEILDYLELS